MNPAPLLSVVIPTRNRLPTLAIVVEQLLSWCADELEVVVEDNSDDPGDFAPIQRRHSANPRLSYQYHSGRRSAVENCDAAVARARGQVMIMIGDDDSITRHCIQAAKWMVENEIDALVCHVGSYTWPDMEHAVGVNNAYNGKLVRLNVSGVTHQLDIDAELMRLARSGAQKLGSMPRVYQSLVQRRIVERLRETVGTCFPGPVPDMANAVSMSKFINCCYYTDIPLIISGQSKNSMSGRNSVRKHQGEIAKEKSLPDAAAANWDRRVPRYWSAPTIWAEAAIKGAEATRQGFFIEEFSFAKVYANCLVFNDVKYYPEVARAVGQGGGSVLALVPQVVWFVGVKTVERAFALIKKLVAGVPGDSFENVAEAAKHLEAVIEERGFVKRLLQVRVGQSE